MHQDKLGRELFEQKTNAADFAAELEQHCNWITCVPDSIFKRVLPAFHEWHFAPRENHAVAMAFGARLAGKRPAVLLQNSGLGLCLDALLGTFVLYKQGLLLIVSNRGVLPWEEIQHSDWGKITNSLLQAAEIPQISFDSEGLIGLKRAIRLVQENNQVVALVMQRGNLDE
jgi:sulfopyruvate decarboxylase TPP-binding subunit